MEPSPVDLPDQALVACHECDCVHRVAPVPAGGKAVCSRCGAMLYRAIPGSINRALALSIAAAVLLVMAHAFPFISLELSGRVEQTVLMSGALALYHLGMGELGLLIFLTSVLFPALTVTGMIYVLLPLGLEKRPLPGAARVFRYVRALLPWSLLGVFMLGVLIAIVKLQDLASIVPGASLFAFAALLVVAAAANANLDPATVWKKLGSAPPIPQSSFAQSRIACHACALLLPTSALDTHGRCPRCAARLHLRKTDSISRTWALVLAAAVLLIPANVYPVMTVIRFGQGEPDTILSGVVRLIEGGMWPLAMIVFFASIVVPVLKLGVLVFLLLTVQRRSPWRPRDRAVLFRVTEVVGAWSMVDIFLVGLLAALVNLEALATIRPGIGATFFAAVVVITLFAAKSFDSRLIWDSAERAAA